MNNLNSGDARLARSVDRDWLNRGASRDPDGWEAIYLETFGMEGALDLLAVQGGRLAEVKMTRRPFRTNARLKTLIQEARDALFAVQRCAYEVGDEAVRADREAAANVADAAEGS